MANSSAGSSDKNRLVANQSRYPDRMPDSSTPHVLVFVIGVVGMMAFALWAYFHFAGKFGTTDISLTPEVKAYARNLRLTDVELKAAQTYLKQTIVEINGKIGNAGNRPLETVEIYCLFHDSYGQLVLRRRLPIVGGRNGDLKPGETKSFRLPFDDLPGSWNQAMPQLVIAGVKFS